MSLSNTPSDRSLKGDQAANTPTDSSGCCEVRHSGYGSLSGQHHPKRSLTLRKLNLHPRLKARLGFLLPLLYTVDGSLLRQDPKRSKSNINACNFAVGERSCITSTAGLHWNIHPLAPVHRCQCPVGLIIIYNNYYYNDTENKCNNTLPHKTGNSPVFSFSRPVGLSQRAQSTQYFYRLQEPRIKPGKSSCRTVLYLVYDGCGEEVLFPSLYLIILA